MYKFAPDKKRFAGKIYTFVEGFPNKRAAKDLAKELRGKGYSARVIRIPGFLGFIVYKRR